MCRRNPMLKEHLLDESEIELSQNKSSAYQYHDIDIEQPISTTTIQQLEDEMAKLPLELQYRTAEETPEETRLRRFVRGRIDSLVVVVHMVMIAIYVVICASAMWIYPHTALELLFTLSFLQGPFVIYQRLQIIGSRPKLESVAMLWSEVKSLRQENDVLMTERDTLQGEIQQLTANLSKYKPLMKGYDASDVTELHNESERINKENKFLAEAIRVDELIQSILNTDDDAYHIVGDAEFNILSKRIQSIDNVPFTLQELTTRFKRQSMEERTLRFLSDIMLMLYVEKRRQQHATKSR